MFRHSSLRGSTRDRLRSPILAALVLAVLALQAPVPLRGGNGLTCPLYAISDRNNGEVLVVQGDSVVRRWPVFDARAIATLQNSVLVATNLSSGDGGYKVYEYSFTGQLLRTLSWGVSVLRGLDLTSDGTHIYRLLDPQNNPNDLYGQWLYRTHAQSPEPIISYPLFRVGTYVPPSVDPTHPSRYHGIAYDSNSIWIANYYTGRIEQRSLAECIEPPLLDWQPQPPGCGALISSFDTHLGTRFLALSPSDQTLWVYSAMTPNLHQFSKTGVLLSSLNIDDLGYGLTGEFASAGCTAQNALQLSKDPKTDNQIGHLGNALPKPLIISVVDASGAPITGVPTSFVITGQPSGAIGASLSTVTASTASNGTASTSLTLGDKPGDYLVAASCSMCSPSRVIFTATGICKVYVYPVVRNKTEMTALFLPAGGLSLTNAANVCGVTRFNWKQIITELPKPSPFFSNAAPATPLTAPPPFYDPPPSGYTYFTLRGWNWNSYPFYWDPYTSGYPWSLNTHENANMMLDFIDVPSNSYLPQGSGMKFVTSLVGMQGNAMGPILFEWTWESTFNGTSGSVSTTANYLPVDFGSGTGRITITSVNGVTQTPPMVSCKAVPEVIWPPNGKAVLVTVSGRIFAGTSELIAGSTRYEVIDKYRKVQPSGGVSLDIGGNYLFGVSLMAERDGGDKDGRKYEIVITTRDTIGNVGSCSAVVVVPHDQGR